MDKQLAMPISKIGEQLDSSNKAQMHLKFLPKTYNISYQ